MLHFTKRIKFSRKGWLLTLLFLLAVVLIPVFTILLRAFEPSGNSWNLITEFFLSRYIWNSLGLSLGVGSLCLIFGVLPAWLVSNFDFPGRKWLKLGLLFPLSIPTYIMAYTYTGIFDSTGTVQHYVAAWFGQATANAMYFDSMNPYFLTVLLAFCLYPYVYSACLISFSSGSSRQLEAASSLGSTAMSRFFRVGLPLAKPALFTGLFLVIMEVLNEYGAVQYFNIKTLTTGIFTAWENGDLNSAVRVALILLMIAMLFLLLSKWLKGKQKITTSTKTPILRRKLSGSKGILAMTFCFSLFLFSFFIPFIQLLAWSTIAYKGVVLEGFASMAGNTFLVSFAAAVIITMVAFLLLFAGNLLQSIGGRKLAALGLLGYSIPGAIIAVGIIIPFVFLDTTFGSDVLLGTVTGLVIAYLIRFLSVSYGPLKGAFERQGSRLDEASLSLQSRPVKTLFKVHLPLLQPAFIMAIILVFVDVMKELPMTLILRPMNYDTLATEAYRYAQTNESAVQAAPFSILLILIGIIPILVLSKLIKR